MRSRSVPFVALVPPCLCLLLTILLAFMPGPAKAGADRSGQSRTFVYRCEGEEHPVIVFLEGNRGHLFARQISEPLRPGSDNASFEGDGVVYRAIQEPDLAPGQTAAIELHGRELSACRNDPAAAVWEGAKLRGVSYRAVGQEPGWILEVDREQGFLLVTGNGGKRDRFPYVEPVTDAAAQVTRYDTEHDGESVRIEISGETCRDTMSGETFSSTVAVEWQGKTLRGCGRALH